MNFISKAYIFLVFSVIYSPDLGAIDMKATQFLYLNIINTIFLIYIFWSASKEKIFLIYKNKLFASFFIFFIACIISTLNSLNISISIERLADIFAILCTLLCIVFIYRNSNFNLNFILGLFTLGLALEVLGSLNLYRQIISITDFGLSDDNDIRGFYGNKNITAAAIAFKIPISLILLNKTKTLFYKVLIYVILTLSFFTLLVLSARAVFVSVILSILFMLFLIIVKSHYKKSSWRKDINVSKDYIITLIIAIIIFLPVNQNQESVSIGSRVQTIVNNQNDKSISQRLRFYSHAFDQIATTPIIGCGIGNWKLVSIKYESKNMYSYVVPFFTHNDFLEIFAETGILGITSYLVFIILIFRMNFTNIKLWYNNKVDFENLIYSLPLIVYFIDMNLNFPLARPSMQILLLIYILILFKIKNKQNEPV